MLAMLYRPLLILLLCTLMECSKPGNNSGTTTNPPPTGSAATFTNPLLPSGPDPWVIQKDSIYYYTQTFGNKIALFKTNKMSNLANAPVTTIWFPPTTGNYAKDIWAPEVHYLNGKWYTYFAADDGSNSNHRIYVLENTSADPLSGTWTFKGKVADPSDKWAIDPDVVQYNGQMYLL